MIELVSPSAEINAIYKISIANYHQLPIPYYGSIIQ